MWTNDGANQVILLCTFSVWKNFPIFLNYKNRAKSPKLVLPYAEDILSDSSLKFVLNANLDDSSL